MKKNEVEVGAIYLVRIGGSPRLSKVRIDKILDPPSYRTRGRQRWQGTNLATGRTITGTAGRLRSRVDDAAITKAVDAVVAAVDKSRDGNLFNGLNDQAKWMIQDAAAAGAKFRKSQAPVVDIFVTKDRTYVHYRDHTCCMFRDMMGNLVPSVANENFIAYTVPDGTGPRSV